MTAELSFDPDKDKKTNQDERRGEESPKAEENRRSESREWENKPPDSDDQGNWESARNF